MRTGLKRSIALCMMILLLLGTVPAAVFAADGGCEHAGVAGAYVSMAKEPATCIKDGHEEGVWCTKCNKFVLGGETITAPGSHNWGAYTDAGSGMHKRTCGRCGETETEAHAWNAGTVTVEAKCDREGSKVFTCTKCAATKTEAIAKPAHKYVETTVAPDCENEGYVLHKCSECGDNYKTNIVRANGHTFGEWVEVSAGDCTHGATKERVCSVCGKKETQNGVAPGHKYEKEIIEPTCDAPGKTTYTCSVCGDTYDTDPKNRLGHHIVKMEAKEATCQETGLTEGKKCDRCGQIYVAQIEIPKKEHKIINIAPITPTCQNAGRTAGSYCEYCKTVFEESVDLPKTDHNYVEKIIKVATCTDSGLVTKTCTYCDETVTEEVAATGHDYELVVISEATCDVDGVGKKVCKVCGHETAETVIKAKGHRWNKYWTVDKAATCTAPGRKSVYCSVCNQQYKSKTIPATGHKYTAATTSIKKATLTRDGVVRKVCAVCGEGEVVTDVPRIASIALSATSYVCDGKAKKPAVVVKDAEGNKLVKGTDYTLVYSTGRKQPGKYAVKVTFTGNYSGTKKLYYKITLAAPKTVKTAVNAKKGTVKIAWSNVVGAQKYVIYYATSENGTYTKLGTSTTRTFTTKALPAGKTYYFKVRAFSAANGKVYSVYSPVASAKVPARADTVYVTKDGKHYHRSTCVYMQGANMIPTTAADAKKSGYTPCTKCIGK